MNEQEKNAFIAQYGTSINVITQIITHLYQNPDATTIPLLPGKSEPSITLKDAERLLGEFLNTANAPEVLQERIKNTNLPLTYRMNVALRFVQAKSTELTSPASAIHKNMEEFNYMLTQKQALASKNARIQKALDLRKEQYDTYHKSLFTLENAVLGETKEEKIARTANLEKIIPPSDMISPDLEEQMVKSLISHTPQIIIDTETSSATDKKVALKDSLTKIAQKDKNIDTLLLHVVGSDTELENLNNLMILASEKLNSQNLSPQSIQHQQLQLLTSPVDTSLTTKEIREFISQEAHHPELASAIFSEITSQAYERGAPLSGQEIVSRASESLPELKEDQILTIQKQLEPIFPELESQLSTQVYEAQAQGYGDSSTPPWLARLVNPTQTTIAKDLGVSPSTVSTNYKLDDFISNSDEVFTQYKTNDLDQILTTELAKPTTEINFKLVDGIRAFQSYRSEKRILKENLSPSLNPIKTYRWIRYKTHQINTGFTNATRWAKALNIQSWNKVYEFEQKLPHNRAINAYFNWKNKIIDRGGAFGFVLDPYGGFSKFVKSRTTSLISKFEGSTSFGGKLFHGALKNFQRGGYTLGGFGRETARLGISKLYHASKKAFGKVGKKIGEGALKLAGKLGMRAIAEGAITVATEGAGAILLVADIAWQTVKGVAKFVKKLFDHPEKILEYAAKAGIALTGVFFFFKSLFPFLFNPGAVIGAFIGGIAGPAGGFIGGITGGLLWHFGSSVISALSSFFSSIGAALSQMVTAIGTVTVTSLGAVGGTYLIYQNMQQSAEIPAGGGGGTTGTGVVAPYDGPVYDGCVEALPARGQVIQGPNSTKFSHGTIEAVDIFIKNGDPIYSIRAGTVIEAGSGGVLGNYVKIHYSPPDGESFSATYAHLARVLVSVGSNVESGQQIGNGDSTSSNPDYRNPHLHFEYHGIRYGYCPIPGADANQIEGCYTISECGSTI